MATLELSTLWDKLEDDELRSLLKAYEQTDGGPLDIDEVAEQAVLDNGIDDDMFSDFLDKLEANEAAADIYLPTDFEEIFEVGDLRIGSSHALLLVLETLREDFAAEEEEDDGDEGDEVATEDEEPEVFEDDESLDLDDDDDDDDPEALYAGDDESPVEIKVEVLRHIWKLMYQGAKASIRRGLCLFVHG
jgi:hypothetical protein